MMLRFSPMKLLAIRTGWPKTPAKPVVIMQAGEGQS